MNQNNDDLFFFYCFFSTEIFQEGFKFEDKLFQFEVYGLVIVISWVGCIT